MLHIKYKTTLLAFSIIFGASLAYAAPDSEQDIPDDGQLKVARTAPEPAVYGPAYLLNMAAKPKQPYGDRSRVLWDRFQLMLGGYWPQLDTEIRVDAINGLLGTTIDLEDALGFRNDDVVPRGDLVYRFGKRRKHRFEIRTTGRAGGMRKAPKRGRFGLL